MAVFSIIWKDPVWSKVIAGFIVLVIGWCIAQCKNNLKKIKRAKPFVVLSIKPVQKGKHSCITVKFKSDKDMVEFQKSGGALVGNSELIGWVRTDCLILMKHVNAWKFKIAKLFLKNKSKL